MGLAPGDPHYRAFVGPPEDYDLIAATSFGLLAALGLRQHHSLLDVGCGSLRIGRLLIPYLNPGGYTGLEPNRWLLEKGIERECGRDQIVLKQPRFVVAEGPAAVSPSEPFDFLIAQSIFSHMGLDLISVWLEAASRLMKADGAFIATFLPADEDFGGEGWIYPDCVSYRTSTLEALALRSGLLFKTLGWRHPRQTWALICRPGHPLAARDLIDLAWDGTAWVDDGSSD